MPCNCIKGEYDCIIDSAKKGEMRYQDASTWNKVVEDNVYNVTIFSPYKDKSKQLELSFENPNIIRYNDIFNGEGQIPDDIYGFKATTCGEDFYEYRFFYPQTQCILDNLLLKEEYECHNKLSKWVEYIKANARNENIDTAKFWYDKLKKEIKRLDCGKCI